MHVVKSNNQYLTVENLNKYTNYSVWVLAYTKVGDGVKTKQLFCQTYEDGKLFAYSFYHRNKFLMHHHSLLPYSTICSARHKSDSCIKYKNYRFMVTATPYEW